MIPARRLPPTPSRLRALALAQAGAGASEAGSDHLMPAAAPLVPRGADPGAGHVAPSSPLAKSPRGSPTPRTGAGASAGTGHASAAPPPAGLRKRNASQPPPSVDRHADDEGAVAAGAGGAAPSPPDKRAPAANTPKKTRRGGGGAPAPARGGRSARGRHPPSTASALGPIANAVAAHQKETACKAKAALDAANAAREEAGAVRAAQDLFLGPTDWSPPLPSTTPAPLR